MWQSKIITGALSFALVTSPSIAAATGQRDCPDPSTFPVSERMARFLDARRFPDFYLTCGHRGMWYKFPENTAPAIEEAIRIGIDCVENDIRATKDGVLVMFHDKELRARLYDPATGQPASGNLSDLTWAELSKLRYLDRDSNKTDYPVLTFEEFLSLTNDRLVVNHEDKTKDPAIVRAAIQMVKDKGRLSQSIFKGRFTLQQFRQIIDGVVSEDQIIFTPVIFQDTPNYQQVFDEYWNAGYRNYELVVQKPNSPLLALVKRVRDNGGRLGQFDVLPETGRGSFWVGQWRDPADGFVGYDFRSDWDFLIDVSQANYLISDRPCLMIQYLAKRNRRTLDPVH